MSWIEVMIMECLESTLNMFTETLQNLHKAIELLKIRKFIKSSFFNNWKQ
jgi:hypothetical protein